MDLGQMILAGLMVSTEAIERMCSIARYAGALGAKLTGAGGGGSVIALVPPAPKNTNGPSDVANAILEAWRTAGYTGFVTRAEAGLDAPDAPDAPDESSEPPSPET
jgi:mevalonate kinase